MLAGVAMGGPHGGELLLLRGGEYGVEFLSRVHHDGAALLVHRFGIEAGVASQGLHALLTVGEDGRDLRGLIGGQAELVREHPGCVSRVVLVVMGCRCGLVWRLGEGC